MGDALEQIVSGHNENDRPGFSEIASSSAVSMVSRDIGQMNGPRGDACEEDKIEFHVGKKWRSVLRGSRFQGSRTSGPLCSAEVELLLLKTEDGSKRVKGRRSQ